MAKLRRWVKRSYSRLLTLFLLSFVLMPYFSHLFVFIGDDSSNSLARDFLTPAAASKYLSSFSPLSFFSGSGKLHLLFLHEFLDHDVTENEYYHMYQLENDSWSQPRKVLDFGYYSNYAIIFTIVPNDMGFLVYFRNGDPMYFHRDVFDGYKSLLLRDHFSEGIWYVQYNEALNSWEEPVKVFGEDQIRIFLNLHDQELNPYLHSFYLDSDQSAYVIWSFEFIGSDLNASSSYSQQFMLSIIDIDGSITFFPLDTPEGMYKTNQFVQIIPVNNSFFLYTAKYAKRAILFSNRSVSSWFDTNFSGPYTVFFRHFYIDGWSGYWGSTFAHRFIADYTQSGFVLVDLTRNALVPVKFSLSLTDTLAEHREIDLEFNHSVLYGNQLVTALIQNGSMELWSINYNTGNCTHVSTLNQTGFNRYHSRDGTSLIDILEDGSNWRIFWDQLVSEYLNDIFTVTYFSDTGEWSPVTQLTFGLDITDDEKHYPHSSESFSLFFCVAVLLGFILFRRNSYPNKSER